MQDKIVLITGATSGIGYQSALALAGMGAQVIVTGRSRQNAEDAVAKLKSTSGNGQVDYLLADLSKQADIRALAESFKANYPRLDVLINNAGLAAPARQITADGVEAMFAVNVVAPFLLTTLLIDLLKASPSGRVVTLMGGDVPVKLDTDNLQSERSFGGLSSYSQSKLAMMVMMYEFAQREKGVAINVCYPGQASTAMTRSVTPEMLPGFMRFLFPIFKLAVREDGGKSAAKASRSSVYLASSADVERTSGMYFNTNCKMVDWPKVVLDPATRQNIWALAEQVSHLE